MSQLIVGSYTAGVESILPYVTRWFVYSSAWSILCGSDSTESVRFLLLVAKTELFELFFLLLAFDRTNYETAVQVGVPVELILLHISLGGILV